MPNIKSVSDLRKYSDVLNEVTPAAPVFLTTNGKGRYVILDMSDYDRLVAQSQLMAMIEAGELSARKHGWLGEEEADMALAKKREQRRAARNGAVEHG